MLVLVWDTSNEYAIADANIKDFSNSIIKKSAEVGTDYVVPVSNQLLILAIRLAVAKGEVHDVIFRYEGRDFEINDDGNIVYSEGDWPKCLDCEEKLLLSLIKEGIKNRKRRRK